MERIKIPIIFTVFLIMILSQDSCSKQEYWMDQGKITGPDYRRCMCCGGYFIEIKDSTYRFTTLPEKSKLDLSNETFPVDVLINWKKKENSCLNDEIVVLSIQKEL
ncbi:MAG: hypothetical protein U0W24_16400 [Bacteroidales bacterium]